MRVVLTNFGTVGDVQPFLALAVEMRCHDHDAVLALSPFYEHRATALGLPFVPIGPDLQSEQQEVLKAQLTPSLSLNEMRRLFAPLAMALPRMLKELREVCRNADALVCGPVQSAGRMIHELTGIPFASVQVAHFGGGGPTAFQQASAAVINHVRAQVKLPPLRDPLTIDANSPQLALYASSRFVHPVPNDWPAHYHMVGYFFLTEENWKPDPKLVEFIGAGSPPVVITFGSTTYTDSEAMTKCVVEALSRADCRAVIQHGWGGVGLKSHLPPNVYCAGYTPHEWLFPRAACVVHHGGAGTAASAFRAGVPSVFVTHAGGQPVRSRFAFELGCAGPPVPYQELSAQRLANAITDTLTNHRYKQAAALLGEKIRSENGVATARQLIEELPDPHLSKVWHDKKKQRQ
jgi:sterol 3beta-glucosyltransferase